MWAAGGMGSLGAGTTLTLSILLGVACTLSLSFGRGEAARTAHTRVVTENQPMEVLCGISKAVGRGNSEIPQRRTESSQRHARQQATQRKHRRQKRRGRKQTGTPNSQNKPFDSVFTFGRFASR